MRFLNVELRNSKVYTLTSKCKKMSLDLMKLKLFQLYILQIV